MYTSNFCYIDKDHGITVKFKIIFDVAATQKQVDKSRWQRSL